MPSHMETCMHRERDKKNGELKQDAVRISKQSRCGLGEHSTAEQQSLELCEVSVAALWVLSVIAGHHTGHVFSTALMFSPMTSVKVKKQGIRGSTISGLMSLHRRLERMLFPTKH